MGDAIFGLLFLGLLLAFTAHLCSLGTPYVSERWFNGRMRYEVWIRRFLGYNDLAGSFDTEEEAHRLKGRVIERSSARS